MNHSVKSTMLMGTFLFGLSMCFTSCEDILGTWDKPTPAVVTPSEPETPEEKVYSFSLRNLADDADVEATVLTVTDQNGVEKATATSDGKYTIKEGVLSGVTELWFEATTATGKYIAKATVEELPAIAEAGKLKMATLGDVILSDGKFGVAGTAGQLAKIAYLGDGDNSDDTYNHGLALALEDVSGTKTWCSQTSAPCLGTQYDDSKKFEDLAGIDNTDNLIDHAPDGHTHAAASAARGYNGGTHPDGTSAWFLPSAGQWDKMATKAGGYDKLGLQSDYYWSSTESNACYAWNFDSSDAYWDDDYKDGDGLVRSCLAF